MGATTPATTPPTPRNPWAGSQRRAGLPTNWATIRDAILRRDDHRCTWIVDGHRCTEAATDVDHIAGRDDHRPGNLRSLCGPHHRVKSSAEGHTARYRHSRLRPPEPHPGVSP